MDSTVTQGEKLCGGCRITKPFSEFAVLKRTGRPDIHCKRCNCERAKRHRIKLGEAGRAKRRADYAARVAEERSNVIVFVPGIRVNLLRDQKWCSVCRKMKKAHEFSLRERRAYSSTCKACAAKQALDWYGKNTALACLSNKIAVLRRQVVLKLGSRCANPYCLVPGGCTDLRALQIDHVNNDGADERRKYGIGIGPNGGQPRMSRTNSSVIYALALADTEGRYQLLCANCNVIKEHERRQEVYRQRREKHLATS